MAAELDLIKPEEAHTLAGLFVERCRRSGNALAYRQYDENSQSWRDYTWNQTLADLARWQTALARQGFEHGDRVALMLRNCREWVLFDLAALSLGLVVVPLYTNDHVENIAYILNDSAVRLLLIEGDEQWQALQAVKPDLKGLDAIVTVAPVLETTEDDRVHSLYTWLPEEDCKLQPPKGAPEELASIVYTSGTTGKPKGVMLSHHNMLLNAYLGVQSLPIYPSDLFLSFLPLSHTLERTVGYYLPMLCGSSVAYARSIPQLGEDLLTVKPTVIISVPRIFERVFNRVKEQLEQKPAFARKLFEAAVKVGWDQFLYSQGRGPKKGSFLLWPVLNALVAGKIMAKLGGRIRVAIAGGAPLSPAIAQTFIGLGLPLFQGYGLTETSPVIAVNQRDDNVPESVGSALRDVEVKLGPGDELLTRSSCIMLGYWNNPAATSAMIDNDGWLHTGDCARIENGHIFITGRIKEIIVMSNGEKVPPEDMQIAINMDALFEQSIVIGEGKPYITAIVVLNPDKWKILASKLGLDASDPASLKHHQVLEMLLKHIDRQTRSFPGYAQVRQVAAVLEPWTVENHLLTPSLKLRRAQILAHHAELVERLYKGH